MAAAAAATTTMTTPFALPSNPNRNTSSSSSSSLVMRSTRRMMTNSFKLNAAAATTHFDPSKVVPQADRVLIRLQDLPEKSAGGVLLPKSAVKFERYLMGEILSVGAEVGEVEAGKKVLFSDINAYEVDLGTEGKHCFCKAGDLLAVVE